MNSTNTDKIQEFTALIVPCYNEECRLDAIQFMGFLRQNPSYSAIFIDDASDDETLDVLESIREAIDCDRVQVLSLPQNVGRAEAIRQGVLLALSPEFQRDHDIDFIGLLDASLTTTLSEIRRMVDVAARRDDIDLVIGSRLYLNGHSVHRNSLRKISSQLLSFATSRMIGLCVCDTRCSVKIFRNGRWLESVFGAKFSSRSLFDIEILARIKKSLGSVANSKIFEYPLEAWQQPEDSRLKILDLIKAPWQLCRMVLKYRLLPVVVQAAPVDAFESCEVLLGMPDTGKESENAGVEGLRIFSPDKSSLSPNKDFRLAKGVTTKRKAA